MEFHEKLQELRKLKGLTQEELAESLYVSRTAVSKWESGRGYPNIDSLKAIAKLYSVTIDELLSGDELLTIAEDDSRNREAHICDIVFGTLDLCVLLLLFLPFFAEHADGVIRAVSLLSLNGVSLYLRMVYFVLVAGMASVGMLTLTLKNGAFWVQIKSKLSVSLTVLAVFVFIVSLQPYAAVLLFAFLIIKTFLLIRWR